MIQFSGDVDTGRESYKDDEVVALLIFGSRLVSMSFTMKGAVQFMLGRLAKAMPVCLIDYEVIGATASLLVGSILVGFGLLTVNKSGQLSGWDDKSKRVSGSIGSTLNEIEGVLIAATEPPFNKQGAKFRGIPRYRQVPHSEAEYVSLSQLRDLLKGLDRKINKLREKQ